MIEIRNAEVSEISAFAEIERVAAELFSRFSIERQKKDMIRCGE